MLDGGTGRRWHHSGHSLHERVRHVLVILVLLPTCCLLGLRTIRWLTGAGVRRHRDGMQATEEEAGMLFGLTQDGKVFFRPDEKDTAFVQLRGEPCGGVWGQPIDVDASSRAIWVVCEKEYMTSKGTQMEHFLFAKWGWSTTNNHVWWHMMRGGNVVQLDADDDAMWGLDNDGYILWRPAGDVGKHSRWLRVDGPPDIAFKLIAADNNEGGTWLWCIDMEDRVWRRSPGDYHLTNTHGKWTHYDNEGREFWEKPHGSVLKDLKANQGWAMAVDDKGNLLKRSIDGSCCDDGENPNISHIRCWCMEPLAPRLSAVTDNGDHGLGFYFPSLQHKQDNGWWAATANRWLELLTSRDDGHNADSPHEASQYFSYHCKPQEVDHCAGLDESISDFLQGWKKVSRTPWQNWDWAKLKDEYGHCSGSSTVCQRPLKHYGAFRERFMQNLFCCSRHLQTSDDVGCDSPICKAYDMTCPGSRLLTSDLDCTVYHSRDPGTLIQNMSLLAAERLATHVGVDRPDLSVLFDVSLYGTWTWIPDEVFSRFDWPASSKSLFERVEGKEGAAVWVFRRKCTNSARQAILNKVKRMIHVGAEDITSENLDELTVALQRFVGNLAEGSYGYGRYMRDWDRLYQDFRAVSSVQREGYLTYAATLEVVGRQQVGLPTTFAEDYQCMRQVSFLEQLAFIAQHIQVDVPDDICESTFDKDITRMLLKSGKYFDRLLEVDGPGYDEGRIARSRATTHGDNSVLWRVLETVYGSNHLGAVVNDMCSWDPASSLSMTTSAFDDAEVRRRSCMDIATWGNAVRHMDAFRRDTGSDMESGDLIRPMVQALFTCLVHPNATTEGTITVKARCSLAFRGLLL
ncbi:PP1 [Symbiodinium sp. CCMP2592]|nr:PP1 [Symbiodinium sp. CCMP2592]